jgi:hypothetical protein
MLVEYKEATYTISDAQPIEEISLQLLVGCDPKVVRVDHGEIWIGNVGTNQVAYLPIRYDQVHETLVCRRIYPPLTNVEAAETARDAFS